MFGTAIISAVGAISQLAIMLILGLPFAVPVAILSFIACFIPYYGGFITTGLAFLIAVAYGSPTQITIMFVYTIVFNLIQGNVVTPLVYNRAVNLHPAIVLSRSLPEGRLPGLPGCSWPYRSSRSSRQRGGRCSTSWTISRTRLGSSRHHHRMRRQQLAPMIEGGIPASAD